MKIVNKMKNYLRKLRKKWSVRTLWKKWNKWMHPYAKFEKADPSGKWKDQYVSYCRNVEVEDNWVLYNTKAGYQEPSFSMDLFRNFRKTPEGRDFVHIYVVRNKDDKKRLRRKYAFCRNVVFVNYRSKGYAYFLARSKYLVTDSLLPGIFAKREDQKLLYYWQGGKNAQGYTTRKGREKAVKTVRVMLMADYLLSADAQGTATLLDSFQLREIYPRPIRENLTTQEALDLLLKGDSLPAPVPSKKRILFYAGMLSTNGVTSAATSFLKNLDYSKYDVTLFLFSLKKKDHQRNYKKLPKNIRIILRQNPPVLSPEEKEIYNRMRANGFPEDPAELEALRQILRREHNRIFGDAEFDYIVDFSGYGALFPAMAKLGYPGNIPLYMWQHNDMQTDFSNDQKRELNKNAVTLDALRSCYAWADKVVSAAEAVYLVNKKNFATEQTAHKFTYVSNLIDTERIRKMLEQDDAKYVEKYPLDPDAVHFVTMGRCMPEKNHGNLIRAINRLNREGHNATLHIIGEGHLRKKLQAQVDALGLSDKVIITGVIGNPFSLLRRCDCFVFPSIYEAQGLAVLEARAVGLPIVVSNYDAVSSVLLGDNQFILEGTDSGSIYDGMLAFMNGQVPAEYEFDFETYNQKALREWDALLS